MHSAHGAGVALATLVALGLAAAAAFLIARLFSGTSG
jgi:hypothetical protein